MPPGSSSALRRLLQEPRRRFTEDASVRRGRCEEALLHAPSWATAKLRAVLAEFGGAVRNEVINC
jgi:hypothetical protein